MNPGQYNLNMEALTCVKDKDGNCKHNPPPKNQFNSDLNKPSQLWLTKHNEEITNMDNENVDCARINAVDKWPTANKRIRNSKHQKNLKSEIKAKKMRLASERTDAIIGLEDLVNFNVPNNQNEVNIQSNSLSLIDNIDVVSDNCVQTLLSDEPQSTITNERPKKLKPTHTKFNFSPTNEQSAINVQPKSLSLLDGIDVVNDSCIQHPAVSEDETFLNKLPKKPKGHTQFHSAHFDIRSSPIKTSSAATFHKFQINPEKLAKYEVQIIRPLDLDAVQENTEKLENNTRLQQEQQQAELQQSTQVEHQKSAQQDDNSNDLHSIFRDDIIALTCKDPNDISNDLAFEATKDWICSEFNGIIEKSDDNFMKSNNLDESFIRSNSLIEPALLHIKEDHENIDKLPIGNDLNTNNHLTESDNRLLSNQNSSVLNFLDSLGSECLSYPETEIRNNAVDFQLDLFSFSNT